jgi:hypothetical protein
MCGYRGWAWAVFCYCRAWMLERRGIDGHAQHAGKINGAPEQLTANGALERLPALLAALGSSDSVSGKVDGVPEIPDKASCSNCPVWHASGLHKGQLRPPTRSWALSEVLSVVFRKPDAPLKQE